MLKPHKKYELIIQFYKSNCESTFYVGLIPDQVKHNQGLDSHGLIFEINDIQDYNLQSQENNTLLFQVCINKQLIQCDGFPKSQQFQQNNNSNKIIINGNYYFGLEFYDDYLGDKMNSISFNELDEFQ
ncbi:hypothetical protein ABPG72_021234 [Tetrahymena utriculariae]